MCGVFRYNMSAESPAKSTLSQGHGLSTGGGVSMHIYVYTEGEGEGSERERQRKGERERRLVLVGLRLCQHIQASYSTRAHTHTDGVPSKLYVYAYV